MNHPSGPLRVDRRTFLCASMGSAVVGALAPGLLQASAAPTWKMRLSCSSIEFTKLPIEAACQRIAALGFDAIDVWSAHAGCPHLDDVQKRLGAEGLKGLLAKHKLKLFAFSVYAGGYRKYAELLGKMGGGVAVRGSAGPCNPKELVSSMKKFVETLKPDLELAEKHNSYLAIENHGHALLDSVDSIRAFVDVNRNPRLGIALAPYHIQALKMSVEEAIAAAGRQLFFFYAWQNAPGTGQLPGVGPTDFTPWLAALARAGYGGYVNPFMHGEPEPETMAKLLTRSQDYLKGCYAKALAAGGG